MLCQWAGSDNISGHLFYRSHRDTSTGGWGVWRKILDDNNYTTYTVKKDGTGATGTWSIGISGKAASADKLATPRNINNVAFDGTKDITISDNTKVPTSRTIAGKALSSDISANDLAAALKTAMGNLMYPIGSIYISVKSTNPNTLFGGTWVAFGEGKVIVGIKSGDSDFGAVEQTAGNKTHSHTQGATESHALTREEIPTAFWHTDELANDNIKTFFDAGKEYGMRANSSHHTGNGHTHNLPNTNSASSLPPYIVCYIWKRTA